MMGMDRFTGAPQDGIEHLAQSIGDILTTPIGSRGHRRDYGSMLFELIDQPLNAATRLLAYAATAAAIRRWEPRFRLTRVRIDAGAEGQVSVGVEGERTDLPSANSRVVFSSPIRTGGVSPVAVN